jgi:hypothetical protein
VEIAENLSSLVLIGQVAVADGGILRRAAQPSPGVLPARGRRVLHSTCTLAGRAIGSLQIRTP